MLFHEFRDSGTSKERRWVFKTSILRFLYGSASSVFSVGLDDIIYFPIHGENSSVDRNSASHGDAVFLDFSPLSTGVSGLSSITQLGCDSVGICMASEHS